MLDLPALSELPDVAVKGPELLLNLQELSCICYGGQDLRPVSNDSGINEEALDVFA